jgi:hypothetical protein
MAYMQSHVPMPYVQPNAGGFYDPNKKKLFVPQQMQQLQGTSVYNQYCKYNLNILKLLIVTTYTLPSINNTLLLFVHYLKGEILHGKK